MNHYAVLYISKYKILRGEDLIQAVAARIASGYKQQKAIRKDAVRAVGVLMSGSHERMKEIEGDKKVFGAWQEANYRFCCQEFGEENIVRFTVHKDKKTPYIHGVFVPITADGRLSAKEYMKGEDCMRRYQDRYGQAMEGFGLTRGVSQDTSALKERLDEAQAALRHQIHDDIGKDLSRVKQEMNLVQHASSMGYRLDKEKSCRRYAVMEKEGDKVIINTSPRHGHWVYMSAVADADRGTIVDFMLRRGYSYRDIRGLSSEHLPKEVLQELSTKPSVIKDISVQQKLSERALLRVRGKNDVGVPGKKKS